MFAAHVRRLWRGSNAPARVSTNALRLQSQLKMRNCEKADLAQSSRGTGRAFAFAVFAG